MLLEVKKIFKQFKSKRVLLGVDLCVDAGELIYIKGINGSGKSTLFKIICDILMADSGTINKADDLVIGALIENPGFLEDQNLRSNLEFLANLNKRFDKEYIERLCNLLGLDYYDNAKLSTYSVGMRQKVGIIQAFMEHQNLILLDEPTRGLDDNSLLSFIDLVNSEIKSGKSIIIASHDPLPQLNFHKKYQLINGVLECNCA